MNLISKFLLFSLLVTVNACSQKEITQNNPPQESAIAVTDQSATNNNGLITISSPYDVTETGDRLESIIKEKGLTLFARIDHSDNAQKAGLELQPTQLLIFGNPKVGTPLMNCSATTAIDLPQKILIVENKDKGTQVSYNSPKYLQQRHEIKGCDEVITKISGALKGITETATTPAN